MVTGAEEGGNARGQGYGLLHDGEMAPLLHHGPVAGADTRLSHELVLGLGECARCAVGQRCGDGAVARLRLA